MSCEVRLVSKILDFNFLLKTAQPSQNDQTKANSGIADHCIQLNNTRLEKNMKKEWKTTTKYTNYAQLQQTAHTTCQLSSLSCSARDIQKSYLLMKTIGEFSGKTSGECMNGPLAEKNKAERETGLL